MSNSETEPAAQTVAETVREARRAGSSTPEILEMLEEQLGDLPRGRAKAIVESIPETEDGVDDEIELSQEPETDAEPRPKVRRRFGLNDFPYLSPREAARAIGLVLEVFDGNTVRPAENSSTECDLYWNRQHSTVGIRVVPAPEWTVGVEEVEALVEGSTSLETNRTPSDLAVVTNGAVSTEAVLLSDDNDIHCIDGGRLAAWLRRARIDRVALGTVLEEGENHDGPLAELVETEEVPAPRAVDPLSVSSILDPSAIQQQNDSIEERDERESETPDRNRSGSPAEPTGGSASGSSESETPTRPTTSNPDGQKGTLYADSDEDGDFGAFDRFTESLDSAGRNSAPADNGDSASLESIDRDELILELLDAKKKVDYPISGDDILETATYDRAQYVDEFGSLSTAFDQIGFEYDGDTA